MYPVDLPYTAILSGYLGTWRKNLMVWMQVPVFILPDGNDSKAAPNCRNRTAKTDFLCEKHTYSKKVIRIGDLLRSLL
jgi:hypothetical protein